MLLSGLIHLIFLIHVLHFWSAKLLGLVSHILGLDSHILMKIRWNPKQPISVQKLRIFSVFFDRAGMMTGPCKTKTSSLRSSLCILIFKK